MKRVLIVSVTPTHPTTAGSRIRLLRLSENMKSLGHDVHFLLMREKGMDAAPMLAHWGREHFIDVPYENPANRRTGRDRIFNAIKRRLPLVFKPVPVAKNFGIDDWYDDSVTGPILDVVKERRIDVVLVLYVFYTKIFEALPAGILKLIDTQDIYSDRHESYMAMGLPPTWYSTTRAEEKKGLDRADRIMAIQEWEAEYFRNLSRRRVITVGHTVELHPGVEPVSGAPTLAYVGSDNADNIASITTFVQQIYPKIRQAIPAVRLILAGSISRIRDYWGPGIKQVSEPNLETIYAQAHLVINPALLGTGLKIKTLEAMGYGKAVVSTSIGAQGMEDGFGTAVVVEDDEDYMARIIIRLLQDTAERRKLSASALSYCKKYNQQVLHSLSLLLES